MRLLVLGLALGLLLGGSLFWLLSPSSSSNAVDASSTWQVKRFYPVVWNNGQSPPDPDHFPDDWIVTLPAHCDVEPVYITQPDRETGSAVLASAHFFYACP